MKKLNIKMVMFQVVFDVQCFDMCKWSSLFKTMLWYSKAKTNESTTTTTTKQLEMQNFRLQHRATESGSAFWQDSQLIYWAHWSSDPKRVFRDLSQYLEICPLKPFFYVSNLVPALLVGSLFVRFSGIPHSPLTDKWLCWFINWKPAK